jgi:hypothetical protein
LILDTLYRNADTANAPILASIEMEGFRRILKLQHDGMFSARFFNLARLNLCEVHPENVNVAEDVYDARPHLVRGTPLGLQFVAACTPRSRSHKVVLPFGPQPLTEGGNRMGFRY